LQGTAGFGFTGTVDTEAGTGLGFGADAGAVIGGAFGTEAGGSPWGFCRVTTSCLDNVNDIENRHYLEYSTF
jgi:hypothetical protein